VKISMDLRSDTEAAVSEIMVLAARIRNDTDHDVFVSYYGHINQIDVSLCVGGWVENRDRISLGHAYVADKSATGLANIIRRMKYVIVGNMDMPLDSIPINQGCRSLPALQE